MRFGTRLERLLMQVPLLRRPFYQRDLARDERDALALRLAGTGRGPAPPASLHRDPDLRAEIRSLAEWKSFIDAHPHCLGAAHGDRIVARALTAGVFSRFLGYVPPGGIDLRGPNHREQFLAAGFNPRQRALLDLLLDTVANRSVYDVAIYAHEGLTPLALALRGRYPRFLGSEYAATEAERNRIFPVLSIDITESGLPGGSFDIVLSGDVLEHVPDVEAALRDTARILVQGGKLIASVPFACFNEQTTIKARLNAGTPDFLVEPEYHGNPMDPAKGSLVFQIPGWDILAQAKAAGFSDAHMLFWSSFSRGLTAGPDLGGVLMLVATK